MPGSAIIRPVKDTDADAIASIYAPCVIGSVISFEVSPPGAEEMRRRVESITASYSWLVCEHRGEVLGYVYASGHSARAAYQWSINVTVYIDARAWRTGMGRALYTSLFALLRLQGYYNVYGGITLPNAGSVGLHEAMGFLLVGIYRRVGYKFAAWHDVGWWGMELLPKLAAEPPPPPRSPDEVRADARWQSALDSGLSLLRL